MAFDINDDTDVDKLIADLGRDGLRANIRELWELHTTLRSMCQDLAGISGVQRATLADLVAYLKAQRPSPAPVSSTLPPHNFDFMHCDRCGKSCRFAPENANGAGDCH